MRRPLLALFVMAFAAACGDDDDPTAIVEGVDGGVSADAQVIAPGCNPLIGDDCATPFPSSFYLAAADTPTGVMIAIPDAVMPVSSGGKAISPARVNGKDGFSPATQLLVYFAKGVDVTQLPGYTNIAASTEPDSAVQILDYATGDRVPLFAELDANALTGERQALIIHPQIRLKPARRYIIALVGLRDAAGQPLAPGPFGALRDGGTLTPVLAGLKTRYDDLFAKLTTYQIPRASLTLAWDITTASDVTATGNLVGMRDEALGLADDGALEYRVVKVKETPTEAHRLREVTLAVETPWYLGTDELMRFDTGGKPTVVETREFPVTLMIPRCAATASKPLPIVVFGHGLFGNAADTLASPLLHALGDQYCMVLAGTDWLGLSSVDLPIIISQVLGDLNKVYVITDRLQQGHVNAQVMTRMLKTVIKDDPALAQGGVPIMDGKELYYFGISNGGIQGGTYMALTPDVERGVLNVPGCEWSLMIFRSTQFNDLYPLLTAILPDPLDRQLVVTASQTEWDHSDPATFAPHLLQNPLAGTTVKRIIVQESIGDAQVPNMSTRILARTMGLTGMGLVTPVYGIAQASGPLDSAYTQWDRHITPKPPTTNTAATRDNGAHNAIQGIPELLLQIQRFFRPDGRAENTCSSLCDFP